MRLINTENGVLHDRQSPDIPSYAILSHRWGKEVNYQEYISGNPPDCEGLRKIEDVRTIARRENFDWVWCDTCCINKESSAELTESINSMWSWYRKSQICYVYLADISGISKHRGAGIRPRRGGGFRLTERGLAFFRKSAWFSRGWTLQELLAPNEVVFYNREWEEIGTRHELADQLSLCTGINYHFLRNPRNIQRASVAMRMSWMSRRQTSREEDMAYCMLGLFGVNMPLLYGEGKKAFMRLQLEIIKKSPDESIFAWRQVKGRTSGLLAEWPTAFQDSGNIMNFSPRFGDRLPYAMTNQGLELRISCDGSGNRKEEDYRTVDMRVAVRQGSRKFQLACGSITDIKSRGELLDCRHARENTIVIYLERSSKGWQRNGDWIDQGGHFRDTSDGPFSLFYIPQPGL